MSKPFRAHVGLWIAALFSACVHGSSGGTISASTDTAKACLGGSADACWTEALAAGERGARERYEWALRRSCDLGGSTASCALAGASLMTANGPQSSRVRSREELKLAIRYLNVACEKGHSEACDRREIVSRRIKDLEQERAKPEEGSLREPLS